MTLLSVYIKDPRIVVRVRGVEIEKLGDMRETLGYLDMGDTIAKYTPHGLITVNSKDARIPVYALGRLKEDFQPPPMYSTRRDPTGHYIKGAHHYPAARSYRSNNYHSEGWDD